MGQYSLASFYFKRFYETFPRSKSAEEANYMYAYALFQDSPETNLDQTNTILAIASMQNFINSYPQSTRSDECTKIIKDLRAKLEVKAYEQAKLYYKTSNYKAAIVAFTNFQKDFSDSDYIEEISYRKIETSYNYAKQSVPSKQGVRYTDVVNFYQEFIEKYPQSKYVKTTTEMHTDCIKQLEEIKKIETKKTIVPTPPTQESQAGGGN
jgi:outer membrane protein assembly factor BamD